MRDGVEIDDEARRRRLLLGEELRDLRIDLLLAHAIDANGGFRSGLRGDKLQGNC